MTIKHPTLSIAVHTWDWKEQPNWSEIQSMLSEIHNETGRQVQIIEIEYTGCDENAIVICDHSTTEKEAKIYYDTHLEWEEGIDPTALDWIGVERLIKVQLDKVWLYPNQNIYKRQCFSILERYTSGERSTSLFEDAEKMKRGECHSKYLP